MTRLEQRYFSQIPLHASDVRVDVIEGELLLYHPEQMMAVYMNAPGAVIWGLCDGQRTLAEIIALIEQAYPAAKPEIAADVLKAVAELYEKKLLFQRFDN